MADVVPMPTSLVQLAERIQKACKHVMDSKGAWVEVTIELATAFAEARKRLPATRAYNEWIMDNQLDVINRADRSALVGMAGHLDLVRIVLQETQSRSWQMIWTKEILPRLHNSKSAEPATTTAIVPAKRPKPEPPPMSPDDIEAARRLTEALDALLRTLDRLDLAAARRGLTGTQRRQISTMKLRVRNWLDILEVSK